MDYLDPTKERAHTIRLIIGYVLIGVAILIATLILLYRAYGFGLGEDGEVIQNGLVFVASQPGDAQIYLDGKLYRDNTEAKLQLPDGQYKIELKRKGYTDWQRLVTVPGGSVQHFTYPKLFPSELKTGSLKTYPEAPRLATQSPDRRWLLVQPAASPLTLDIYDLADYKRVAEQAASITLPENLLTNVRSGSHTLALVEWSTDNRHLLLLHTYGEGTATASEYIMVDHQKPAESVNLTRTLSLAPTAQLQLYDKKFDQYYIYDSAARTLGRTSIAEAGAATPLLEAVIAYKPYGKDMVLYVTDKAAPASVQATPPVQANAVTSMLYDNGQTYKIREHGPTGPYLIDLAEYKNSWFVVVGASGDNKVYVYKNPQRARKMTTDAPLVPVQIMRMQAPTKLQFSSNTQLVMIENGMEFVDYDVKTAKGYHFTAKNPLDPPAVSATWMDGQRLMYVSGGKVVVFDYDNLNRETLVSASSSYLPFFDRDYETLYTLAPGADGKILLTTTSMLTPADR